MRPESYSARLDELDRDYFGTFSLFRYTGVSVSTQVISSLYVGGMGGDLLRISLSLTRYLDWIPSAYHFLQWDLSFYDLDDTLSRLRSISVVLFRGRYNITKMTFLELPSKQHVELLPRLHSPIPTPRGVCGPDKGQADGPGRQRYATCRKECIGLDKPIAACRTARGANLVAIDIAFNIANPVRSTLPFRLRADPIPAVLGLLCGN